MAYRRKSSNRRRRSRSRRRNRTHSVPASAGRVGYRL